MNWRIDLSYEEAVALATTDAIRDLRCHDQLTKYKQDRALTARFEEGELTFRPTYKYDSDCDVYDTSKKQRTPSYTDRVLYKPGKTIRQTYYNRIENRFSDHRPVLAMFDVVAIKIDQDKKEAIRDSCVRQIKQSNNMTLPSVISTSS